MLFHVKQRCWFAPKLPIRAQYRQIPLKGVRD